MTPTTNTTTHQTLTAGFVAKRDGSHARTVRHQTKVVIPLRGDVRNHSEKVNK